MSLGRWFISGMIAAYAVVGIFLFAEPAGATGLGDIRMTFNLNNGACTVSDADGIASDSNYFYIVNAASSTLMRYNKADGTCFDTFITLSTSGNANPSGVAIDDNGFFYVTDTTDDEIYVYNPDGSSRSNFDTAAGGNGSPFDNDAVAPTSTQYIYVADNADDEIYTYTTSGVLLVNFDTNTSGGTNPIAVTKGYGNLGGLLVSDNTTQYDYFYNFDSGAASGTFSGYTFSHKNEIVTAHVGATWDGTGFTLLNDTQAFSYYATPTSTGSWNQWPPYAMENYHEVTDTFTVSSTWTAPAGVTSTLVELWGGGGAGDEDVGAGGGGAYSRCVVSVTAGNAYFINIGRGGLLTGGDGGETTFATSTCVAAGGYGGSNAARRGLGGSAASSTGDVEYPGGQGWIAVAEDGGGASAGDVQMGKNGMSVNSISGAQVNGGYGAFAGGSDTNRGQVPGGGGKAETTPNAQTAGRRGEARVTYQVPNTSGFPDVRGVTWAKATSTSVNPWSVDLPETESGDMLLLSFFDFRETVTTPSGWTRLDTASSSNTILGNVFWKTADGTEDVVSITTTPVNIEDRMAMAMSINNAEGTPYIASTTAASVDIVDPAALNTGVSDKYLWILMGGGVRGAGPANGVTSTSDGYGSFRITPHLNPVNGVETQMSYKLAEAASDDPGTIYTQEGDTWAFFTIAVAGADAASAAPSGGDEVIWFSREDKMCKQNQYAYRL